MSQRSFGSEIGNKTTMTASNTSDDGVSLVKHATPSKETSRTPMEKPENGAAVSRLPKALALQIYAMINSNNIGTLQELIDKVHSLVSNTYYIDELVWNDESQLKIKSIERVGELAVYTMTNDTKFQQQDLRREKGLSVEEIKQITISDVILVNGKTWKVKKELLEENPLREPTKSATIFQTANKKATSSTVAPSATSSSSSPQVIDLDGSENEEEEGLNGRNGVKEENGERNGTTPMSRAPSASGGPATSGNCQLDKKREKETKDKKRMEKLKKEKEDKKKKKEDKKKKKEDKKKKKEDKKKKKEEGKAKKQREKEEKSGRKSTKNDDGVGGSMDRDEKKEDGEEGDTTENAKKNHVQAKLVIDGSNSATFAKTESREALELKKLKEEFDELSKHVEQLMKSMATWGDISYMTDVPLLIEIHVENAKIELLRLSVETTEQINSMQKKINSVIQERKEAERLFAMTKDDDEEDDDEEDDDEEDDDEDEDEEDEDEEDDDEEDEDEEDEDEDDDEEEDEEEDDDEDDDEEDDEKKEKNDEEEEENEDDEDEVQKDEVRDDEGKHTSPPRKRQKTEMIDEMEVGGDDDDDLDEPLNSMVKTKSRLVHGKPQSDKPTTSGNSKTDREAEKRQSAANQKAEELNSRLKIAQNTIQPVEKTATQLTTEAVIRGQDVAPVQISNQMLARATFDQVKMAGEICRAFETAGCKPPADLKAMFERFKKEMEAEGKTVNLGGKGFEGHGYKYDEGEAEADANKKKMTRLQVQELFNSMEKANPGLYESLRIALIKSRSTRNSHHETRSLMEIEEDLDHFKDADQLMEMLKQFFQQARGYVETHNPRKLDELESLISELNLI